MNKINIEEVDNGWILTYFVEYEDDENELHERKVVYSYNDEDDGKDKIRALTELYWEINEHIGVKYSKHNDYNILIKIDEICTTTLEN